MLAADFPKQLLDIMLLVDEKKYPEAISGYESFLKGAPPSMHGAIQFEIATLHAATGNRERALAIMEQAVKSGFDDCFALEQYEELKSIRSDPRFNSLKSQVRISEADMKELFWLKAEMEHINHDIKMMITENMNRVDTGITMLPQSVISTRATTSTGVLFHRELVKMMHLAQQHYVGESDQARMEHVGSMTVISGGTSSAEVLESSRLAEQAATGRKQAINARKFSIPPGTGTTPRPCGEL